MSKSNELALPSISLDNVPELLKIVNNKLAKLGSKQSIENSNIFTINFKNKGNLNQQKCVSTLIKFYSNVLAEEDYYGNALNALDMDVKKNPLKIDGHSSKQWKDAISFKINEVKNKEELDKFRQVKKELEGHLSKEEKFKQSMSHIANLLSDE